MLGTACRAGEIIGLTWSDVDILSGDVSIDHQQVYKDYGDGYRFHCVQPKTKAGVRRIEQEINRLDQCAVNESRW